MSPVALKPWLFTSLETTLPVVPAGNSLDLLRKTARPHAARRVVVYTQWSKCKFEARGLWKCTANVTQGHRHPHSPAPVGHINSKKMSRIATAKWYAQVNYSRHAIKSAFLHKFGCVGPWALADTILGVFHVSAMVVKMFTFLYWKKNKKNILFIIFYSEFLFFSKTYKLIYVHVDYVRYEFSKRQS